MSRVGKKPLPLPKGVEATINGRSVTIKGAKGSLTTPGSGRYRRHQQRERRRHRA